MSELILPTEESWRRLPSEPARWFGRFDMYYRPLGSERSIVEAYRTWHAESEKKRGKVRKSADIAEADSRWYTTAIDWQWKQRAQAWDYEQDRKRRVAEAKAIEESFARFKKLGQTMQGVGGVALNLLAKDPSQLSANEARLLVQTGIDIERQTMGLPDYVIKLLGMTPNELRARAAELMEELRRSGESDENRTLLQRHRQNV